MTLQEQPLRADSGDGTTTSAFRTVVPQRSSSFPLASSRRVNLTEMPWICIHPGVGSVCLCEQGWSVSGWAMFRCKDGAVRL